MRFIDTLINMRKVTLFALPISSSALIQMIGSFAAMLMVAQLGKEQLAAGALSVTTFITLMTVVTTIFYAVSILISHYKGQGKPPEQIGELVKNGLWLALFLIFPVDILLWNADKILLLFKQDPQLVSLTRQYFHFAALSMIPTLLGSVITQFFTGTGRPRFMMATSFMSLPMTILLSYGFVLGNLGFPQLGLAGVTCAAFISQSLVCIVILTYMYFGKENKTYRIFSGNFLPNPTLCKNIFVLGFPIGIQFGGELAAMSVATYFLGYFGVTALAASQIVSQYAMLVVMVILGLSQAVSVLSSEAYGKRNLDLITQYIFSSILILTLFFSAIFLIFITAPTALIGIYVNVNDPSNSELIHLAIVFFIISAVTLFLDGIRNILSGSLRGLHDSKAPMQIGIACLWAISLPVNYAAGFIFNGGPIGMRLGFMTGFIIASILLWMRVRKRLQIIFMENIPHLAS